MRIPSDATIDETKFTDYLLVQHLATPRAPHRGHHRAPLTRSRISRKMPRIRRRLVRA